MSDWQRRLLIGVLVVATLSAGCLGAPGGDRAAGEEGATLTGDFTEAEFDAFLDEVAAANDETETFAFEMTMEMDGDAQTVDMRAAGNASVVAEEMKLQFEMDGDGVPAGQATSFVMYIDGSEAFVEAEGEWVRMPVAQAQGDVWNVEDELAVQEAQYEHGDVHVEERADTVVVTTELDAEAMDAVINATESPDPSFDAAGSAEWRDVEIVERFDAETNRLRSTEMTAQIEQYGQTLDYAFEMEIEDVNEELETTVPPDVREAATEPDETTA